ncbi:YybH family protein [Elongatibacter sediminis]|uniref:DUF4440 domain-containing protein n=1 Tax=Elongatibacter sediminis TaxID=3119006 RepID=A0AAW9RGS2_9GAMM
MSPRIIVLSLVCCATTASGFDSPEALQNAFMEALRAGDADGIAACYTDDATNFTPDRMIGYGPDSARQSWGGFFEQYQVMSATLSEQHMVQSGDLAAAWGLFTINAQPRAGGEPIVMKGRYMDVARNFEGQWLYLADHASVPLPPQE